MVKTNSRGYRRCPICFRTREEAINEQLSFGKSCNHPGCAYKEEVSMKLKEKINFKINNVQPKFTIQDSKKSILNIKELLPRLKFKI